MLIHSSATAKNAPTLRNHEARCMTQQQHPEVAAAAGAVDAPAATAAAASQACKDGEET